MKCECTMNMNRRLGEEGYKSGGRGERVTSTSDSWSEREGERERERDQLALDATR